MSKLHLRLPSPAMVVACVALVAALAGTAWAAKKITSKQLANKAVTTKKIKNSAVTEAKIANGAVTSDKLAAGSVPRAYAYIDPSQNIVAGQSKGMGSTTVTLDTSFVCFNNMPFTPKNVQVTVVRQPGSLEARGVNTTTQATGDISFCTGAENATAQFFISDSGIADGAPPGFFVAFYD